MVEEQKHKLLLLRVVVVRRAEGKVFYGFFNFYNFVVVLSVFSKN